MNIVIGADHRGFQCKAYIKQYVIGGNDPIVWIDVGATSEDRSDYPIFARAAVEVLQKQEAELAILLCGSGVGMAIVANRYPGMFAGVAWNSAVARESKEDDNTNILVLPADFISNDQAVEIVNTWINARFKGGRYQERITMIDGNR
jgi:ribose 5-phosphate isomerase B